jgi:2-amino-4-hydroxy-6-hydroxymethyldihydropteridine diphosphokinase
MKKAGVLASPLPQPVCPYSGNVSALRILCHERTGILKKIISEDKPVSMVYLSLGSNLGDRAKMLRQAIATLNNLSQLRVLRSSAIYETEPWDLTSQPKFLNIVVEIETALEPLELLNTVKTMELRLGRKVSRRWGPRCIDIDLVLWGAKVLHTSALTLPHERFRERAFVLTPFAELAPEAVDPETGLTVAELAGRLDTTGLVRFADPICS